MRFPFVRGDFLELVGFSAKRVELVDFFLRNLGQLGALFLERLFRFGGGVSRNRQFTSSRLGFRLKVKSSLRQFTLRGDDPFMRDLQLNPVRLRP